jgi:hypothetical protein
MTDIWAATAIGAAFVAGAPMIASHSRLAGVILAAGGLAIILTAIMEARSRGRRARCVHTPRAFVRDLPDGTTERLSHGYVLRLSPEDRRALLSSDRRLERWFQNESSRVRATKPVTAAAAAGRGD